MKKILGILFIVINSNYLFSQISLKIEGSAVNNTETGIWYGVNIPRLVPTFVTYRNNSITSVNAEGYMLCAGDEMPSTRSNNLDEEVITGNNFNWNGTYDPAIITHGLFTGYNINSIVKYNYLENVPFGILYKSGNDDGKNMTFTSGGCAYNICKNGKLNVRMKGINGVKVYNNTFYSGDGSGWFLIYITPNPDRVVSCQSIGSKIFNNIFFSTTQIPMIRIESGCLTDFESDYNIFWCSAGEPTFSIDGVKQTWAQWQALGYDTHSKIVNPNFINTIDFVPADRLDYGTDLGTDWQTGLSTTAVWAVGSSPATTNQNGKWQVGARVRQMIQVSEITVTGKDGATTIKTGNGTLQLQASALPSHATTKTVTWSVIDITGKASISTSGLLTAEKDGTVKAIATATDGSGVKDELLVSISNQIILVENLKIIDNLKNDTISGIGTKLNLKVSVTPQDATNTNVEWKVENITGQANIDVNGVLTTLSAGKIKVSVKALDESKYTFFKEYIIVIPLIYLQYNNHENVTIYPNPTTNKIRIQIDQMPANGVIIEISNSLGQIIIRKSVKENSSEWSLEQYHSRIFLVTIIDKNNTSTYKIIYRSTQ